MATHPAASHRRQTDLSVTPPPQFTRNLEAYVVDDPQDGMFTVDRNIFTDPVIFDLEMKYIFEGTWIYLGHESQLPQPHDFYTTTIGRQPIILMRNQLGEI